MTLFCKYLKVLRVHFKLVKIEKCLLSVCLEKPYFIQQTQRNITVFVFPPENMSSRTFLLALTWSPPTPAENMNFQ